MKVRINGKIFTVTISGDPATWIWSVPTVGAGKESWGPVRFWSIVNLFPLALPPLPACRIVQNKMMFTIEGVEKESQLDWL